MKNKIPVFFAADDGYCPFLAVAIHSLVENSSKSCSYCIKILNTDISTENKRKILKYRKDNVDIEFVDVGDYIGKIEDKLYTRDYYSKTTYFRLFIPELYPQYDKALYLDSDIVVLGNIAELFGIAMEDNLVAAAVDDVIRSYEGFRRYAERVVGVADYRIYFNAGVLLMNLKELRDFKFQEKFLGLLDKVRFAVAQDQDYMNRICRGRVKFFDRRWNRMPIPDAKIPTESVKLVHYNLAFKPWHFEDILYNEFFWKYACKTEYFDKIREIRENYSETERAQDNYAHDRLIRLAWDAAEHAESVE